MSTTVSSALRVHTFSKGTAQSQRVLLSFLLLVAICFLRRPDVFLTPQFYAEDGAIFYNQQVVWGTVHSIFQSYADYLLVIPRLLTAVACLLPIRYAPLAFAVLSVCVIGAIGSLFSLNCYRYLVRSDFLRVALPALLFGVTDSSLFIGNFSNLIWYFTPLALIVLLTPKEYLNRLSTLRAAAVGLLMALLALSQPLCVILAPFALWHLVTLKKFSRLIPAALLLGIAIQVACVRLVSGGSGISLPVSSFLEALIVSIGTKAFLVTFAGERSSELMNCQTRIEVLAILLSLAATCAVILWKQRLGGRWLLLGSSYLLVASIAVPIRGRLGAFAPTSICAPLNGGGYRYYLFGSFVVLFLLVVLIDHFNPRNITSLLILCGIMLPAFTDNFAMPYDQFNSHWCSYVPAIRKWKLAKRNCQPAYETVIPVTPPGWDVDLPAIAGCDGKAFPDRYVITTDRQQYYLVDRGQKRLIPHKKTIDELRVSRINIVTDETLASMPPGINVPALSSYVIQNAATGEIDVIDHGRRRYVPDPNLLAHLGPSDPIQPLLNKQFQSFTRGPTLASILPAQTGKILMIKDKRGVVYMVEDDTKHRIPDPQTLNALGITSAVRLASSSELNSLLTSYELPHVPGRLLQNSVTGAVFLMDGGRLRHIPDPITLKAMHLKEKILPVSAESAEELPQGPPMPHLEGAR